MTGPVAGRAAIQIVADASRFAGQLQRDADTALRAVRLNLNPISSQIAAGMEKGAQAGGAALKQLDGDAQRAFRVLQVEAARAFDALGPEARAAGAAVDAGLRAGLTGVASEIAREINSGLPAAAQAGDAVGATAAIAIDEALSAGTSGTGSQAARQIAGDAVLGLGAARPTMAAAGALLASAAAEGIDLERSRAGTAGAELGVAASVGIRAEEPVAAAAGKSLGNAAAEGVALSSTRAGASAGFLGAAIKTGLLAAVTGVSAGLVALTAFGLHASGTLEQTQISLESLTGSAANGLKTFKALQQFAAVTPFEFPQVTPVAQQFLAFASSVGISQQQLIPFLTTLGDVASVTGAGAEGMQRVALTFGQIASAGKLMQGDLRQVSTNLPGFSGLAAIAAARGESTAQALEEVSKGSISAHDAILALLDGMQKFPGAAGAMAKQSETLLGVLSTFKDVARQALADSFAPVVPQIKASLTALTPVVGDALKDLAPALGQVTSTILPLVGQLLAAITPVLIPVLAGLKTTIAAITPVVVPLGNALGLLASALAPIAGPVAAVAAALATGLAPVLAGLTPALAGVAAGVSALTPLAPVIAEVGAALGGALVPAAQAAGTLFAQLAPVLARIAGTVGTALVPVLYIVGNALGQVLTAATPLITTLVGALEPILLKVAPLFADLVTAAAPLIPAVLQLVPPVLQLVEAFLPLLDLIPPLLPLVTTLATLLANVLAGAVGLLAGQLANMVQFFHDTPGALAAAAIALGAWVVVTKGATIAASLQARATVAMASAQSGLASAFERTRGGATRAALAIGALAIAGQALDAMSQKGSTDTQGLEEALRRLGETGQSTGELTRLFGKDLENFQAEASETTATATGLARGVESIVPGMSSLSRLINPSGDSFTEAKEHIAQLDETLAQMVRSGHANEAQGAFVHLMQAAHLTASEMEALAPKYVNAIGEVDVATKNTAKSTDFAKQAADSLLDSWDRLNGKALTIDQAMLDATHAIDGVAEAFRSGGRAVAGNSQAALENRVALREAAKAAEEAASAYLNNGGSAEGAAKIIRDFKSAAEKATGATGAQRAAVDKLADSLFALPKTVAPTVTVKVYGLKELQTMNANLQAALSRSGQLNFDATRQAAGGILRSYAGGGMEQHVAQIVPAGAMRLWAEPETGGEAYIPLAAAKRDRSLAVLAAVADDFGYGLTKTGESLGSMSAWAGASGRLTDLLATTTGPPAGAATGGPVQVRVFIGERELTDIVRVEVDEHDRALKRRVGAGR